MQTWVAVLLIAAVPKVSYRTEATAGSWRPLEPPDLAQAIEHAALEVLTKPALMQLEKIPPAKKGAAAPAPGEYTLHLRGRLLDEAETHTVYLSFGPGEKSDLPSFNASHTVVLSKLARGAMLAKVEESAKKAAAQLLEALRPSLERVKNAKSGEVVPPPKLTELELPWQWSDVRIPKASASHAGDLYSKDHGVRQAALRELTSLALVDASPRNALESCALEHKDEGMRLGCLQALRPLSRRSAPTQRVVVEVIRKEDDRRVVDEANDQAMYFTGAGRAEAIQAWLENAARGRNVGPLGQLGDIPNLDSAIAGCMLAAGKRPKYERGKSVCIELISPIASHQRRRALLMRSLEETDTEAPLFLEGAGEREGSTGTDWQRAVEKLLETMDRWDPALEEILWKRYQRFLSSFALDALSEYAAPSEKLAGRLLEVVQTAGARRAVWGLERIAKKKAELRPMIKEKLSELVVTGSYPKSLRKEDLEGVIKAIDKLEAKAAEGGKAR